MDTHTGISDMPTEILFDILERVPNLDCVLFLTHGTLADSLWSINLRVKRLLLLVCKKWLQIGSLLLYRNVTVFQVGGFMALSKAIEDNPARVAHAIHALSLRFWLPSCYSKLVKRRLDVIYESCPNLRRVDYDFSLNPLHPGRLECRIPGQATHISLGPFALLQALALKFYEARERLTHLSLNMSVFLVSESTTFFVPTDITFSSLQTLIINIDLSTQKWQFEVLKSIFNNFKVPSIKTLEFNIFANWVRYPPDGTSFGRVCAQFCKKYRQTIESLRIRPYTLLQGPSPHPMTLDVQGIINECSSLKYLGFYWSMATDLTHPTLSHIDIWHPQPPIQLNLVSWDCPSIQHVRVFTTDTLKLSTLPDCVPWTIDPTSDSESLGHLCLCRVDIGFPSRKAILVHPHADHSIIAAGDDELDIDSDDREWEATSSNIDSSDSDGNEDEVEEYENPDDEWEPSLEEVLDIFYSVVEQVDESDEE
ncbi:hypothetical protein BDN72DRAFT_958676 [Pluteus cervinus]|uniref:Uncharacterized protein n=1 Tax=Pluteus cervinus TaxID=181527 RepID=A0ACD3AXR6_9AGAR|nr:hypothetical protein BDN72DRAFT_958676 [Pluteus cervinus]